MPFASAASSTSHWDCGLGSCGEGGERAAREQRGLRGHRSGGGTGAHLRPACEESR